MFNPGTVADFVTPSGMVALTFDVAGAPPSTHLLTINQLRSLEKEAQTEEQTLRARYDQTYYQTFIAQLAERFLKAFHDHDQEMIATLVLAAWCAIYNHPKQANDFKQNIDELLRKQNSAHITWRFENDGLAIAIADSFVDMEIVGKDGKKIVKGERY